MIFRFSFLSIVYFAVICSAPSANYATDKPDYKLISPDKICHAVYHPRKASYFNKTPSTYVSVSCGGGAYGVFEAEGNHYKLKLEWLNDLNLKITHPKGITIKDQLGAIRKRTGIGERKLTISYDPP